MSSTLALGIVGATLLVVGSAWPVARAGLAAHRSVKNWLFAVGASVLMVFAYLGFQAGGNIFFVVLQALATLASIATLMSVPQKISVPLIGVATAGLVLWSIVLFENYTTLIFIAGLVCISLGYVSYGYPVRRNAVFVIGGLLIAVFSYLGAAWVFFWLNIFFTLFSLYHLVKLLRK